MKEKLLAWLICVFCIGLATTSFAAVERLPLDDQDCIKCHLGEAGAIAGQESAHKNDIGCLDCHESHPPEGEAVIPECSKCHDPEDSPHFGLTGCTRCHNPHAPLVTDFGEIDEARPVCITCHDDIDNLLTSMPSAHNEQDCTACHNAHGLGEGQYQTCLDCHEKHAPELELADCFRCHQPHQPTGYQWKDGITSAMCAACHEDLVQEFNENGAAHLENLACTECHATHPPQEDGVIPSCSNCHDPSEKDHYNNKKCTECHNPHAPKKIDFGAIEDVRSVCAGCHPKPVEKMKRFPSAHAEQECTSCHPSHGEKMSCLECHDPHGAGMQYGDCLKCHNHHAPMPPRLGKKIPSKLCGSCHDEQYKAQKADTSKHSKLQCVFCHKSRHKVIQECRTCHGEPHDVPLHKRFPDCHKCHGSPHNLKNK